MTANKAKNPDIKSVTSAAADKPEPGGVVLEDKGGKTIIQPDVVAKIAGLAIREVDGVHALAAYDTGQAIANLAKVVGLTEFRKLGVHVEVGQVEAAVDARIITDYGASIPQIADTIRTNVSERIAEMTGLKLKELNLEVVDLYFGEEPEEPEEPEGSRVQ